MEQRIRRSLRDYSLAFKVSLVDAVVRTNPKIAAWLVKYCLGMGGMMRKASTTWPAAARHRTVLHDCLAYK